LCIVESLDEVTSDYNTESQLVDLNPKSILNKRELNSLLDINDTVNSTTIRIPITTSKEKIAEDSKASESAGALDCYTKSEMPGNCLTFKKCYPLLFNTNGILTSTGLAEVLFQNAGPCNSSSKFNLPSKKEITKRKHRRGKKKFF